MGSDRLSREEKEIYLEDLKKLADENPKNFYLSYPIARYYLDFEDDIEEVKNHLANLIDYAIAHFERLKKTYGKGRERKTEIRVFDTIEATKVVVRNTKLYVNRAEGFGHLLV